MKKKPLFIFLILTIVLISYYTLRVGEQKLESFAADSLKELALGKSGKGYFVNFQKFHIEWTKSRIEATGISIIPHINQEKKSWVNGTVDTLVIEFSNLISGAFTKNITINNFKVIHPNFQYFWKHTNKNKDKKHTPLPKFDAFRKRLSKIGIHSISIINTEFNGYYVTNNYRHHHVFHTSQNFILKGLEFNFDSLDKTKKIVALEDFHFSCGPTFMKGYGDLYQYHFDSLIINNKEDFFQLEGVVLNPQYDEDSFFKKVGKQTDRYEVKIKSLQGNGLKEIALFNQDKYHLENIVIDGLETEIYRNKNYEEDTTVFKSLPHIALRNLDFQIAIDSLSLRNSQFTYKEKSKNAKEAGLLNLSNLNGVISNINNSKNNHMKLDLTFDFLEKSKTAVNINLFLGENEPHFIVANGTFGAFPLSALNKFTHPNMGVLFLKGNVTEIDFNATLNDSIGRGDLDFYYNNLKIKITGKNDNKSSFVESLAGFAANNVVYKHNYKHRKPRHAPLYFKRIKYKSVIHFLIHTILSGAETAVIGTYGQLPDKEKKEAKHNVRHHKRKKHS